MSNFTVLVFPVRIEPHPNADSIELAVIGEYRSVVQRGRFKDGDLAAYIPEGSVLPPSLIEEMNLVDRLAGSAKNRVKAIRLRGVLSQGLCYPARDGWVGGQDVTEVLGLTKYEPVPPTSLSATIYTDPNGVSYFPERTLAYDVENYKRWPSVLIDGEWVIITEKLHGTFVGYSLHNGKFGIFTKGLGSKGFLLDQDTNKSNVYIDIARQYQIEKAMREVLTSESSTFVLGEIYGTGIQDLKYGTISPQFRVFDVRVGKYFMGPNFLRACCKSMGLEMVPLLYEGPYSLDTVMKLRDGSDSLSGTNVREGVVVRSTSERIDASIGRVQLKFVSDHYLCRRGKTTEYN